MSTASPSAVFPNGTLVSLGEAQIAENQIDEAIRTYAELSELFPDDLQMEDIFHL